MTQFPLIASPHNNQQLFSDHYLDVTLPQRQDWLALIDEAKPIMAQIATIFKKYKPSNNEPQTEDDLVKPVLRLLGHTFEIQAPLATPQSTQKPDYIFYRNEDAKNASKGKKLTEALLQPGAFAVGDAKYWNLPLDIALKSTGSDQFTNKNPSYQIAFYMQHSGLEWGILTNGRLWRLYHKASAHKLDHFYEVDLPSLLVGKDDDAVKKFLYFYAFFRRAAFDQHALSVSAILKESIDYAQGIGESLKKQVYEALRHVAEGFLDYTHNKLNPGDPATLKDIYDNSLIVLYRLLFLLYAEARGLLPLSESEMYHDSYSLYSITHKIAEERRRGKKLRTNSVTLWAALKQLFDYINEGDRPLKIAIFNGGLFDPRKHLFLEQHKVGDAQLQQAIDKLARVDGQFIDYRDLSIRHLGTIYEGLLEHHLEKAEAQDGWSIDLLNSKGERHTTGSYYTPDYIVKYLVDQTVGPGLQAAVEQAPNDKAKVEDVLAIKVLDPAMGSGHFLVEATEYIARFLVELNAQPPGTTKEAELAYWKRRVVQSCIYGVDLNPLAVELAKLSLWLSTVAKDRPLSFLDHHLRTGNALIGARLANLTFTLNGNGNGTQRKTKKPEAPKEQLSLFDDDVFRQSMTTAVDLMWLVKDSPAQTVEQVKEQEQLYATMREGLIGKYGNLANLITAVYYGVTIDPTLRKPLVDFATGRPTLALPQFEQWLDSATAIANQRRFFHWELEFPEVFFDKFGQLKGGQAGFDAVVGNPPWIRQEAFREDKTALKRLFQVYHGVADLSTYFVELGNTYLKDGGRFGFIIPNKFVRANYGEALRTFLAEQVRLERLVDFGDLPVFQDATTYPMIVLTSKPSTDDTPVAPVKHTLLKQVPSDNLAEAITVGESIIPPSALAGTHWSLEGERTQGIQAIMEKMKTVSIPLGQYAGEKILYGIKTGFNEAFVIDQRTRDRLIAADPKSAEIIKPFLVGEDIKRYRIDYKRRYLIFTRHGVDLTMYKAIEQHLLRFKPQLEPRPSGWNDKVQGKWQGRKPGSYKWYEIQDTVAYYDEFEKPKIIYPNICRQPEFAYDNNGYYSNQKTFIIPTDDKYLLTVLNSGIMKFLFGIILPKLRGGFFEPSYVFMKDMPILRIAFTTAPDERIALADKAIKLYQAGKLEELLTFVEACLANQPEQSDVVHNLLVYLAERMIDFNKKRQEAVEDLILGLDTVLSDTDLQKISRLWTPSGTPKEGDREAQKQDEAQEILGPLAARQLDLHDDIGLLNEEQWKWLLKQKLGQRSNLVHTTRVYKTHQPSIAAFDTRITITDHLINQIVYRFYSLTPEEITIVEGKD